MLKYFILPIVFLCLGFVTGYYALTYYQRDKNQSLVWYNYSYLIISGLWIVLALYYFSFILRQLV